LTPLDPGGVGWPTVLVPLLGFVEFFFLRADWFLPDVAVFLPWRVGNLFSNIVEFPLSPPLPSFFFYFNPNTPSLTGNTFYRVFLHRGFPSGLLFHDGPCPLCSSSKAAFRGRLLFLVFFLRTKQGSVPHICPFHLPPFRPFLGVYSLQDIDCRLPLFPYASVTLFLHKKSVISLCRFRLSSEPVLLGPI